jgi:hypothetical protein
MADQSSAVLSPDAAIQLSQFARACKAAARAVSLYPADHPAIGATLSRLAQVTTQLTDRGPFRVQVLADRLLVSGAGMPRGDAAVAELAALLHRHLIGTFVVNPGADAESWRTLLLLLARPPEDVRADGGIARLWSTAGGPSVEIEEIDYAEVLREKQGLARSIETILAAAMAGSRLELDDSGMRLLLDIVQDPSKIETLVARIEETAVGHGAEAPAAVFLKILRQVTEHVAATDRQQLPALFQQLGRAARKLSADSMLALLARRAKPDAMAANINVVSTVVEAMADESVAQFVAGSVIAERGASERLAHAFSALVPELDRQRRLLALARDEVAASDLGHENGFPELWERVEGLLSSYTDESYVSREYARELSHARTQAVDVEQTSDDPPERIAAWLSTVGDAALRSHDHALLMDLLAIESDPLRWRDIADTVVGHADDLVRVGYYEQAWQIVEAVAERGALDSGRQPHAAAALERFGRGSMMKHVSTHFRSSPDDMYERFKRLCHAIGPSIVAPLAEVLSAEQDARARRRLRDIMLGFGSRGRESVQQLMNAQNWEVRRTAAYLLREFGGSEGLKELIPLLTDTEPLVQREAVQGLVLNGSEQASEILIRAIGSASGRTRETLVNELVTIRHDRAAPLFCHLVRQMDRRRLPQVFATAIDALGSTRSTDAVEALKFVLQQGDWWTPFSNRRARAAAAQSLRRIGTPEALTALREAASRGPRGARAAARAELGRIE